MPSVRMVIASPSRNVRTASAAPLPVAKTAIANRSARMVIASPLPAARMESASPMVSPRGSATVPMAPGMAPVMASVRRGAVSPASRAPSVRARGIAAASSRGMASREGSNRAARAVGLRARASPGAISNRASRAGSRAASSRVPKRTAPPEKGRGQREKGRGAVDPRFLRENYFVRISLPARVMRRL